MTCVLFSHFDESNNGHRSVAGFVNSSRANMWNSSRANMSAWGFKVLPMLLYVAVAVVVVVGGVPKP